MNAVIKASREILSYWTNYSTYQSKSTIELTVQDIPKSRVGAKLVDIYRVDTTPKSEFDSPRAFKIFERLLS